MNDRLERLRAEIDTIDGKIIDLLCERFQIVNDISDTKNILQTETEDSDREKEVIDHCKDVAGDRLDDGFIEDLISLILSHSKKIQRMRREK